jgi:cobalamin-dependent methionine synthase I
LGGCNEALWCAATAGSGIAHQIHESEKNNLTRAVIFDAVASEMTDSALDWIVDYVNGVLRRENKQLTSKRISCGYADFDITYQKTIYEMLKLKILGIEITETCMLVPEKSVTAVLGIRDIR